jgi:hypothetical protein
VWISTSDRGAVLWVYDAQGEEITTRILASGPPFESSAAASVALSLKTLLRATEVAPESERFGAPPPGGTTARARWQLQIGGEDRFFAAGRQDLRFMVGACWWWRTPPKGIGLSAEVSAGPGATVSDARFTGRFRDLAVAPSLRWQVVAGERAAAVVQAGPSAHFTFLDGSLVAGGAPASSKRVNITLDAGAFFDFEPSTSIHLGAGGKISYLTGYQRYLVNGAPVLELWPVAAEIGLRVAVDVP